MYRRNTHYTYRLGGKKLEALKTIGLVMQIAYYLVRILLVLSKS